MSVAEKFVTPTVTPSKTILSQENLEELEENLEELEENLGENSSDLSEDQSSSQTSEEHLDTAHISSNKILQSLKSSVDNRIDNLSRQFEDLSDEMSSFGAEIDKQTKMRSIEWAIDNVTKYGIFQYRHTRVNPNVLYESPDFVRTVLIWFRKGKGTFIDNDIYISDTRWENPSEVEKEGFRDKLSGSILMLTGQKPRLVRKDGKYTIHYS